MSDGKPTEGGDEARQPPVELPRRRTGWQPTGKRPVGGLPDLTGPPHRAA